MNSKDVVVVEFVEILLLNLWRMIEKGMWIFFKFYKFSIIIIIIDDVVIVEDC